MRTTSHQSCSQELQVSLVQRRTISIDKRWPHVVQCARALIEHPFCSVSMQIMIATLQGLVGKCGNREVFMAFAPAATLVQLSFADVLNETTGKGYQRPFSPDHSLEFKRYIQQPGATSIPLTFNLRNDAPPRWWLERGTGQQATLHIDGDGGPVFAQVDGQHRLGYLQGSPIPLAFITFLGMTVQEEMEVFRTINGKAKGLSGSLLDYTEARLLGEHLPQVRLDLYVALRLHEDPLSPWRDKLSLSGKATVGMQRGASLRTMQTAVKRFIRGAGWKSTSNASVVAATAVAFWRAVAFVLPRQWDAPRTHVLTKGIGVYALMSLAGLFTAEALEEGAEPTFDYFVAKLSDFIDQVDWSNDGPLKGYGGAAGADAAFAMLIQTRAAARSRFATHA